MRLKNLRKTLKDKGSPQIEEQATSEPEVHHDASDDINYLRSVVVNEENMGLIRQKLNSTRSERSELLKKPEVDLKEYFHYFFTHPELVCFSMIDHFEKFALFIEYNFADSHRL